MKPSSYLTQAYINQNGQRLFLGRFEAQEAEGVIRRAKRAIAKGLRLDLMTPEARRSELEALRSKVDVLGPILLELGNSVLPDFNWAAASIGDKFKVSTQNAPAGPRRIQQAVHYLATAHDKRIRSTISGSTLFCKFILPDSDRADSRVVRVFRNSRAASPTKYPPRPKHVKDPARALRVPPERRRRSNSVTARLIDLDTFTPGTTRTSDNTGLRPKVIAFLNYRGIRATTRIIGSKLFVTRD